MRFFDELYIGVSGYRKAHAMVFKERMWKYLLIPGIIHIALLAATVFGAWYLAVDISDWLMSKLSGLFSFSFWPALERITEMFLRFLVGVMIILLYLTTYKYIILMIMAPVFAYLSEVTQQRLTGQEYPFNAKQMLNDIIRGILINLRNLVLEIFWIISIFVFSFIPIIGLLGPFILIVVQSYFLGFSVIDFYMERERLSVKQSVRFMRKHKGFAIGIGMVFYFLLLIPVLGWFATPIYSTIAATVGANKLRSNELQI
ncbi:MAG: EI24 domain-containing protein [Bacteroidetes bacterium]|nr:EI24 domain-containing protein [Bacteroidota bacterium]